MPFPAQASAPVCRPLYLPICIYLSENVTSLRKKLWERNSCCQIFGKPTNFTIKMSIRVKKFHVNWENKSRMNAQFLLYNEQMY